jgi:hypothetical protein
MAHYSPPTLVGPSKVVLWEQSIGRLELGDLPFVVESFQIGSPAIRDNIKNRALADGEFDDTLYHGSSAITLTMRLAPHMKCSSRIADYYFATLRDTVAAYMTPRLRPRLYWRYPGDPGPVAGATMGASDGAGQWAEVRGASWPFTVAGPKYPTFTVQFKNPLGQMFLGDPEATPHTASSFPGIEADGRAYDLTFDRDFPNITVPLGTAVVHNNGNSYADWRLEAHGPFDAGATINFLCPCGTTSHIELNQAVPENQYVIFDSRSRTILTDGGVSYYPHTNFGEWSWDRVRISHGDTYMTFDGVDSGSASGWATIEWRSTSI